MTYPDRTVYPVSLLRSLLLFLFANAFPLYLLTEHCVLTNRLNINKNNELVKGGKS